MSTAGGGGGGGGSPLPRHIQTLQDIKQTLLAAKQDQIRVLSLHQDDVKAAAARRLAFVR
jgi:hypothetical protein